MVSEFHANPLLSHSQMNATCRGAGVVNWIFTAKKAAVICFNQAMPWDGQHILFP